MNECVLFSYLQIRNQQKGLFVLQIYLFMTSMGHVKAVKILQLWRNYPKYDDNVR